MGCSLLLGQALCLGLSSSTLTLCVQFKILPLIGIESLFYVELLMYNLILSIISLICLELSCTCEYTIR